MSRNLPHCAMMYMARVTFAMAQYGRQRDLQPGVIQNPAPGAPLMAIGSIRVEF